jgi:medium-chain acyl-[acyl-carrier-protein] hydrolase
MRPSPHTVPGEGVADLGPWVQYARPVVDPRVRLLCFHHAGGAASSYRLWPGLLGPRGIEVWPVQLPGRESRSGEPLQTDLAGLTATLAQLFAPVLDRPYALYGHSAGALVAYAFALHNAASGMRTPRHLFLGAQRPLSHPDPDHPIHRLPTDALLVKLQEFGGMPAEILGEPDLVEMVLRTVRADLQMVETADWSQDRELDCPVSIFGGAADHSVPVEVLPAWRPVTRGLFDVTVLPGGHFRGPAAEHRLLEVLDRALC